MAETYAIVESGGKQYRAEKGAELVVDRLSADEGANVGLRAVMFRSDGDVVLDGGDLEKVKVEAKVAEHLRGEKLRVFKYKPKKGYRRRGGHRSELTKLEVTDVRMLSRKPAAKSKAESKPKPEPRARAKAKPKSKPRSAPKKQAEKGAAAKRGAAAKTSEKGAAKKASTKGSAAKAKRGSAAKKPSGKATGAKKPAAKKGSTSKPSSTRKSSQKKRD